MNAVEIPKAATARPPRRKGRAKPAPTQEERAALVAVAAYYRAEKRGFAPGAELEDWLDAEAEIALLLSARQPE
jgi:hypothetical protein